MNNNIVALWMVHSETYNDLCAEAVHDCQLFGIDPSDDNYKLHVMKCVPAKIEDHRVELWRGWAVLTWGSVEPQLLLNTVMAEEASIASGLSSLLSSPPKQ